MKKKISIFFIALAICLFFPVSSGSVWATETGTQTAEGNETGGILINGASFHISADFLAEEIPFAFAETTVNYHGTDYRGASFEKGPVMLLFLAPDGGEAAGTFFVYEAEGDRLYPFVRIGSEEKYVIALKMPVSDLMPDTYRQTELAPDGVNQITAYQKNTGEEDGSPSEFYVFYGMNQDGAAGWYQYDAAEGTYQRLSTDIYEEDTQDASSDMEYMQKEYDALSKQYEKEKSFSRNMIAVLVFLIAVLVIALVNLLLHRAQPGERGRLRRKAKPEEDEWTGDTWREEEDSPEEDGWDWTEDENSRTEEEDIQKESDACAGKKEAHMEEVLSEEDELRQRRIAREMFFSGNVSDQEPEKKTKKRPEKKKKRFSDDLEDDPGDPDDYRMEEEAPVLEKKKAVKEESIQKEDEDEIEVLDLNDL